MNVVEIKIEECTGCGECVSACPLEMFELTDDKKSRWKEDSSDECIACEACVSACETGCLALKERD